MFCTNCGFEFEGNFCPRCGTKARIVNSAGINPVKEPESGSYPMPPVGEYKAAPGVLIIGENEIGICARKTELHIPFAAIQNVRLSNAPLGGDLRIAWDNRKITQPDFPKSKSAHLFEYMPTNAKKFKTAYEFLDQVAHINSPTEAERDPLAEYREKLAAQKPVTAQQRIRENKKNAVACCPKCGSTSLSANKKGFGIGKAIAGMALTTNALGIVAGGIGSKKVIITCLNCGHQWKP